MNTNTVSEVAAWHALSQAEVVQRLVTNSEKGLDLSEASTRLQKYGTYFSPWTLGTDGL